MPIRAEASRDRIAQIAKEVSDQRDLAIDAGLAEAGTKATEADKGYFVALFEESKRRRPAGHEIALFCREFVTLRREQQKNWD